MNTRPDSHRPLVVLAGGKSGGHVFPALAVGEELRAMGAELLFVGLADGMEQRLAREREIPFEAVDARPLVGRGALGKVRGVLALAVNALRARRLLRRRGVDVVLGTGGFVSAPTVLGARLAGLPVVLLEPNAEPGAANRLLSRFSRLAAVAHPETGEALHCPVLVTGVPIRAAFFEVPPPAAVEGRIELLIMGGSQGAQRLNRDLPALLSGALDDARIVHQCGAGRSAETLESWRTALGAEPTGDPVLRRDRLEVEVRDFIDDVPAAVARAQLVVCRAGAITLAELCAAGRPAILVPLSLAGGHQVGNARRMEVAGAALLLEEAELEQIGGLLRQLIDEPRRLAAMGTAARSLAHENAAGAIAEATRRAAAAEGRWAA